jgi:hypothetical protein
VTCWIGYAIYDYNFATFDPFQGCDGPNNHQLHGNTKIGNGSLQTFASMDVA